MEGREGDGDSAPEQVINAEKKPTARLFPKLKYISEKESGGLEALNDALDSLSESSFKIRKAFLGLCVDIIAHDEKVTAKEPDVH